MTKLPQEDLLPRRKRFRLFDEAFLQQATNAEAPVAPSQPVERSELGDQRQPSHLWDQLVEAAHGWLWLRSDVDDTIAARANADCCQSDDYPPHRAGLWILNRLSEKLRRLQSCSEIPEPQTAFDAAVAHIKA